MGGGNTARSQLEVLMMNEIYIYTFLDKDSAYVHALAYKSKEKAIEAAVADFADCHDDGVEDMKEQMIDCGWYDNERVRYEVKLGRLLG